MKPENEQCLKLCNKSGEVDECTKNTINGRDENGCLFEVCYTRGTCGPLTRKLWLRALRNQTHY